MRIGVLAVQGSFHEHIAQLNKLENVEAVMVKTVEDLKTVQAIILPGGESTAMRRLLNRFNLMDALRERIKEGMPVWGTCAGMILLAKTVVGEDPHLGLMDVTVERNAYGTQLDSFDTPGQWLLGDHAVAQEMVFIRAPRFVSYHENVQPAAIANGQVVGLWQGRMLATAFHPELIGDCTPYQWLLDQVAQCSIAKSTNTCCEYAG